MALFCREKQCSGLFRYFFVVFSWLFRGPRFGQILRVLALEQSSDVFIPQASMHEECSVLATCTARAKAWMPGEREEHTTASEGEHRMGTEAAECCALGTGISPPKKKKQPIYT